MTQRFAIAPMTRSKLSENSVARGVYVDIYSPRVGAESKERMGEFLLRDPANKWPIGPYGAFLWQSGGILELECGDPCGNGADGGSCAYTAWCGECGC